MDWRLESPYVGFVRSQLPIWRPLTSSGRRSDLGESGHAQGC